MVTLCWAAKGGSGTTVVTATLALTSGTHALLVDLDGDAPSALGLAAPDRPGVADWLESDAPAEHLADIVVDIGSGRSLLPFRFGQGRQYAAERRGLADTGRWCELGGWLHDQQLHGIEVFVDGGTGTPPTELVDIATRSLLVTRSCYLALNRAVRSGTRPTGVILVDEPGRSISARDVERAIGAPVVATVSVDPAVSRAVDAGLLASRLPRVIRRELRGAAA